MLKLLLIYDFLQRSILVVIMLVLVSSGCRKENWWRNCLLRDASHDRNCKPGPEYCLFNLEMISDRPQHMTFISWPKLLICLHLFFYSEFHASPSSRLAVGADPLLLVISLKSAGAMSERGSAVISPLTLAAPIYLPGDGGELELNRSFIAFHDTVG